MGVVEMSSLIWLWVTLIIGGIVGIVLLFMSIKIVKQYERGVVLRFGRLHNVRDPGIRFIIPVVVQMTKVWFRIVTLPIQSQGTITRDNVSVGVSAVAYFRVVDAVKSVIASAPAGLLSRAQYDNGDEIRFEPRWEHALRVVEDEALREHLLM